MRDEGPSGSDQLRPEGTIANNAAFALAAQLSTAIATAAITIFLVRELGPDEYGIFALALSIAALAILPSDLGLSSSAGRFIAEHREDRLAVAGVVGLALRAKVIVGLAVSALLFAFAGPIADFYDAPGLVWPLRAVAVAMFGQALMQFIYAVFIAVRRLSIGFRLVLSEAAAELIATVALVLVVGGAASATWGRALGYAIGALLAFAMLSRLLGSSPIAPRAASPVALRPFLKYAVALFVIDGAFTLFSQIDVLLIGSILGTAAAGLYSAPLRLIPFLAYPGLALARAVAPMAAGGGASPSPDPFQKAFRFLFITQALLVALIVVWAEPIVDLALGAQYEDSITVLRVLAPFVFLSGLAPLVSLPINFAGRARMRVPIAIAAVVLNVVIDLIYIPKIGIVAGAWATNISFALYVGAHLLICRAILDVRLAPLLITFIRCAIAAGAAAGVMAAFGTSSLGAFDWIAGGAGAVVAYVGVLLLVREVSIAEIGALASRIRGALARRTSPAP